MDLIWNGNIEHIAEHGLTQDDVQFVFDNPVGYGESRSTGEPAVFGYTPGQSHVNCRKFKGFEGFGRQTDASIQVCAGKYTKSRGKTTIRRAIALGYTPDGRYIIVVYAEIDKFSVYPVTAFEVPEPNR